MERPNPFNGVTNPEPYHSSMPPNRSPYEPVNQGGFSAPFSRIPPRGSPFNQPTGLPSQGLHQPDVTNSILLMLLSILNNLLNQNPIIKQNTLQNIPGLNPIIPTPPSTFDPSILLLMNSDISTLLPLILSQPGQINPTMIYFLMKSLNENKGKQLSSNNQPDGPAPPIKKERPRPRGPPLPNVHAVPPG